MTRLPDDPGELLKGFGHLALDSSQEAQRRLLKAETRLREVELERAKQPFWRKPSSVLGWVTAAFMGLVLVVQHSGAKAEAALAKAEAIEADLQAAAAQRVVSGAQQILEAAAQVVTAYGTYFEQVDFGTDKPLSYFEKDGDLAHRFVPTPHPDDLLAMEGLVQRYQAAFRPLRTKFDERLAEFGAEPPR